MIILSGIKPSGRPHLGNYLGAMQQQILLQQNKASEDECLYFIADLHALTSLKDKTLLKEYRTEIVLDYLALGMDPEKSIFFYQSAVPEHAQLHWILSNVAPFGLLERAHAWKDFIAKGAKDSGRDSNVGLFTYPILMASDILLYQADSVPVGKDQKQHVEIARDIAEKFNNYFGETFTLPNPKIQDQIATIKGTDSRKMSKSYGNTISLFEDEAVIKKQIMSIKTASIDLASPMPIENDIILEIYSYFASAEELNQLKANYMAGGFGYGRAKTTLFEKITSHFKDTKAKRADLSKSSKIAEIMAFGAEKAQKKAQKTLDKVYERVGLV